MALPLFSIAPFLAASLSASVAASPLAAGTNPPPASLCEPQETEVLAGSVEDDLGFDLAVCLTPQRDDAPAQLAIRWEGEGGGDSLVCAVSQCAGKVALSRYTRPRVTMVRLTWVKGCTLQSVTQLLDAELWRDAPLVQLTHVWRRLDEQGDTGVDAEIDPGSAFPMRSANEPLSLMALEAVLERGDWGDGGAVGNQHQPPGDAVSSACVS